MRQQELRQALAVMLVAGVVWLPWQAGSMHDALAKPGSAGVPEVTARWRYVQVPPADLAAVQQSETQLELRYRAYQRAWQAYVEQLHHCQARLPRACTSNSLQTTCDDQALMQCLGAVVPALDAARGALHDQAISIEEAVQHLAGVTE